MTTSTHPLFSQFPLTGKVTLSTGEAPTPYHIYDGYGLFLSGSANMTAVKAQMTTETLQPIRRADGRAQVALWVMDFTRASLAPHRELQCSVFVAREEKPPLDDHPLAVLKHMIEAPTASILCADIWNDTAECVAYNTEHLGLGARLCHVDDIGYADGAFHFRFSEGGALIAAGRFGVPRLSFGVVRHMIGLFGWGGFFRLVRLPYTELTVINRVSDVIDANAAAQSYTSSGSTSIALADPARDSLSWGDVPFANIDFVPEFGQIVQGVRFVYLAPAR